MMKSSTTSLATGLVVGSSATLLVTWLWQQHQQRTTSTRKKDRRNATTASSSSSTPPPTRTLPAEIRAEQLSRHTLYFGENGMTRLRDARVCVVGLGGVGSHTAVMLARAGIRYLKLIDFDQVTVSSLNRHACATLADVGLPKAVCLERYLRLICPDPAHLQVQAVVEMYTAESGEALLLGHGQRWDLVIDAIDDTPTKAALLAQCLTNNIRVISCMGAAGKADFTRLHCSDLRTAAKDPLATKLRTELKRILPDNGYLNTNNDDQTKEHYLDDMDALSVVYCSEKTVVKLADFTEQQKEEGVHEFGAVDGMRIRVLPVLGTMPAIMGQSLAALALTRIGHKPIQPVTGDRVGKNVRHKLYQHVKTREGKLTKQVLQQLGLEQLPDAKGCQVNVPSDSNSTNGATTTATTHKKVWIGPIQIVNDDVDYLMQVWRNRCAVTGDRLGKVLHLARWDLSKPSTSNNIVLMGTDALQRFDRPEQEGGGIQGLSPQVRHRIESRLATIDEDI